MFATAAEAKTYILAHDNDVKILNRKPRYELVAIERSELEARGYTRIYGGPHSKDELINAIADGRYPHLAEAQRIYYASVTQ